MENPPPKVKFRTSSLVTTGTDLTSWYNSDYFLLSFCFFSVKKNCPPFFFYSQTRTNWLKYHVNNIKITKKSFSCLNNIWNINHCSQTSSILGMILNCTWWWGSSSGDLGSVNYTFIAIIDPFWPWIVVRVRVSSMDQIDLFKNY